MNWLPLVLPLVIAGCTRWKTVTTPPPELLAKGHAPESVRLTAVSGETVMLKQAYFRADTIAGFVERKSAGQKLLGGLVGTSLRNLLPWSIPAQDVVQVEIRKLDGEATTGFVFLMMGLAAAMFVALGQGLKDFRPL